MLKLQARLQQYVNFQMFKLNLENGDKPEIKLPTLAGSSKKQELQKNIYLWFIDYSKAFDCVDYNKLWKILKENTRILDHLTCFVRNLYVGQEARVRTGHGTTDWFKIGKGVRQGYILLPFLFNLHAEYIMWNARLDEVQLESRSPGEKSDMYREGNGTSLQYSCLENPMDGGAW